jgi:hypothetical protein
MAERQIKDNPSTRMKPWAPESLTNRNLPVPSDTAGFDRNGHSPRAAVVAEANRAMLNIP